MLKRLFLAILLSVCCFESHSQTLQLKEFVQRDFDLSARRYMRKDVNGDTCALVKVQLALPEAQFKGQIAGDTELKVSTYWVYMSPGSKRVNVSVPGFLPLDIEFENYGIKSLQSQTTYIATIEVPTDMLSMAGSGAGSTKFFKKNSIYFGGAYSLLPASGANFLAGFTIGNVNAEASYALGIGSSPEVGWYSVGSEILSEVDTYKLNCFSVKAGYQLAIARRFGIMPQVGYKAQILQSSGERGNGATCGNVTAGVKIMLPIFKNMRLYVEPEYALAIQKSDTYSSIVQIAKFEEGGLFVSGGIMFNF